MISLAICLRDPRKTFKKLPLRGMGTGLDLIFLVLRYFKIFLFKKMKQKVEIIQKFLKCRKLILVNILHIVTLGVVV